MREVEGKAEAEAEIDAAIEPLTKAATDREKWTWETIEEERVRGLRIAECMARMEELHGEFVVYP